MRSSSDAPNKLSDRNDVAGHDADRFPGVVPRDRPRQDLQPVEHLQPFVRTVDQAEGRQGSQRQAQTGIRAVAAFQQDGQPHAEEGQSIEKEDQDVAGRIHPESSVAPQPLCESDDQNGSAAHGVPGSTPSPRPSPSAPIRVMDAPAHTAAKTNAPRLDAGATVRQSERRSDPQPRRTFGRRHR
jgi:hypothetical protein